MPSPPTSAPGSFACRPATRSLALWEERELEVDGHPEEECTCAVCLDLLGASRKVVLPCGHCYHLDCAQPLANCGGKCPLCRAVVAWDHVEGISVVSPCKQPAHWAGQQQLLGMAYWGDVAGVQGGLARGVELESRSRLNATPLILAAMRGHEAVVRLLLQRGANVHATTDAGKTALWVAGHQGHSRIAGILLSHSANPNVQSEGMVAAEFPAVRLHLPRYFQL